MENKGLISVIVPVYKVEDYLDRCVKSIVNQTYTNLEIILVDDGSPDNCPKMCDEWGKRDSRIKVFHKENGGLSSARNFGINKANGDFITFIDSDDYVSTEMISKLLANMKDGVDIVCCNYIAFTDNVEPKPKDGGEAIVVSAEEAMEMLLSRRYNNMLVPACMKLFRKALFNEHLFQEGKIHEDELIMHYLIGSSTKVCIIQDQLYYYYTRQGSIVNSGFSEKHLSIIEAMEDRQRYIQTRFPNLASQMQDLMLRTYSTMYCKFKQQKAPKNVLKLVLDKFNAIYNQSNHKSFRYVMFKNFKILYYWVYLLKTIK